MVRLSPRSFRVLDDAARPSAGAGDHVGLVLREARLNGGHELGQVAAALRIRHAYLAAIEDGRFDALPGPAYAVGFVRSYAEYLGLRPGALVERFKAEVDGVRARQALDFPTPMPEGRFPGGAMLTVGAVLAAAVFGGWYYLDQHGRLTYPRIPQLPAATLAAPVKPAAPFVAAIPPRGPAPMTPAVAPPATAATSTVAAVVPVDNGRVVTEAPPVRDPATSLVVPPSRPEGAAGEEDEPVPAAGPVAETIPPEAADADAAEVEAGATSPTPPMAAANAIPSPATPAEAATAAAPVQEPVARPLPVVPVTDPAATAPSGAAAVPPAATPPAAPMQQAAVPPPPQAPGPVGEAGRVLGRVNHDARIVLNATADSWVQVRDGAQNVLFTQMLRAGDSYRVPNREDLVLLTGNAGGLIIAVDGSPVPMLGPEGAVLRNVRLDAGALKAGTATRN